MSSSTSNRSHRFVIVIAMIGILIAGVSSQALGQRLANGDIDVSGHLDVRAVEGNVAVGNNDFQIGQFIVDLSSNMNDNIKASVELAYASDAREMAVDEAYINWNLFTWDGTPRPDDPIGFTQTGFIVGQFDVPFGIDWRVYRSIDRPLVSIPLVITNTHRGWNDLGVQFYTETNWANLAVFAVNGFGTSPALRMDEVNQLPQSLIASDNDLTEADANIIPTEAYGLRFGLLMNENVEFGTSFAAGYLEDNSQQSRLFGVDATMHFNDLELKGEFISRRREFTAGRNQDLGYYVQGLYNFGRQFGVLRGDAYRQDGGPTNFCTSAGAGYRVLDNAQLRAEYRMAEGSSNDTVYLQSVIAF